MRKDKRVISTAQKRSFEYNFTLHVLNGAARKKKTTLYLRSLTDPDFVFLVFSFFFFQFWYNQVKLAIFWSQIDVSTIFSSFSLMQVRKQKLGAIFWHLTFWADFTNLRATWYFSACFKGKKRLICHTNPNYHNTFAQ